ncbi:hypothetical protein SAMN02745111_02081 [Eubacterium uniforme]|uniref:Uncharacterized protein n=1 Tax=Eubacterium uniforme TaxID=39495 RepID=A0A1T4W0L9_9FIRM|nr:hypothetical protein [Eubacterium uniforme]SKA70689.1 hypothetical protein SAMN02745111_02081 [Eubacterium uniforme]
MIKRIIIVCMILAVVCCNFDYSDAYGIEKDDSLTIFKNLIEEEKKEEIPCVSKRYKKSIESWNKISDKLYKDNVLKKIYAGAYIDDNDELVVMLTKKVDDVLAVNVLEDVKKIKYVEYTYKELDDVKKIIINKMDKYNYINSVGIDEKNNVVEVGFISLSNKYFDEFKKNVIDSDCVKISKESKITGEKKKLRSGEMIHYRDKDSQPACGSIGFRARSRSVFGTINGFVTAGHVGYKVGLKIYADERQEKQIGKVHITQQSGKIDAAFVELTNSNYDLARQVKYKNEKGDTVGVKLNCVPNNPIEGQIVYKSGAKTYLTSGKVKKKSTTIKIDDIKYNDVAVAKYKSAPGDSGGVIYEPFFAMKEPYCPVGIHAASGGVFIKIQNILDKFKLELY